MFRPLPFRAALCGLALVGIACTNKANAGLAPDANATKAPLIAGYKGSPYSVVVSDAPSARPSQQVSVAPPASGAASAVPTPAPSATATLFNPSPSPSASPTTK